MLNPAALAAAFGAGLIATAHCTTMCGPLILGSAGRTRVIPIAAPAARRATVVPRQAGRLLSYTLLGAIAGGLGQLVAVLTSVIRFEAGLYLLFNLALISVGLFIAGMRMPGRLSGLGLNLWRAVAARGAGLAERRSAGAAFLTGMVWGCVPCAAIYAVLPLALLSGSSLSGAALLLAFGAGTLPGHVLLAGSYQATKRMLGAHLPQWLPRAFGGLVAAWGAAGVWVAIGIAVRPGALLMSWCS